MKSIYFFLTAFTLLSFCSCLPSENNKPEIQEVKKSTESLPNINVKPLSTDKTHEGGVDTTTAVFK